MLIQTLFQKLCILWGFWSKFQIVFGVNESLHFFLIEMPKISYWRRIIIKVSSTLVHLSRLDRGPN